MDSYDRWNLEAIERYKREAVEVANLILSGRLGIIAGCRHLASLGHHLVEDWRVDMEFVVFGNVESETDHLPLEDQRSLWNPAAFEEKQREVARFEESAREEVLTACRSVIARFGEA
jgi:P2-related tail formation protein